MVDFLKDHIRLSQTAFMLALLVPGAVMLWVPSLARWGRRWVFALLVGYLALGSQAGAALFARTLGGGYRPIASKAEAGGARVVVVLGSGSVNLRASGRQLSSVNMEAGLRVLEAARLFDLLNGPLIIVSGGVTEHDRAAAPEAVALRRALVDLGIPTDRILLESESKNTRDEVLIVKRMLAERGESGFVLVTSPLHMGRSTRAFEHEGLHPIPSPSSLVPETSAPGSWWRPNDLWLHVADATIYEWMARGYYWWRGWTR
jgi:uncharacterized SAM-binding protein YcdF (DUF218 family)